MTGRRHVVLLALLLSLTPGPPSLSAQRPLHSLLGVVKDTEGAPIQGVEVLFEPAGRKALTDGAGVFRLDSIPAGNRRLLVRRIGYYPVQPLLLIPRAVGDTFAITMLQVPQPLPLVEVEADRPGIRGTVGDTGYRALRGTLVELLGASRADTADELGHFEFEHLKPGQYLLRFARPGYGSRLISAHVDQKGLEYAVFLKASRPGSFDWASSNQAGPPLFDLGRRLAWEPDRNRMTRSELARYGSLALCEIRRLPHARVGAEIVVILRGSTVYLNADICAWSADQIELLEWGDNPCREATKTVAELLGNYCGPQRSSSLSNGVRRATPMSYVILWPRN